MVDIRTSPSGPLIPTALNTDQVENLSIVPGSNVTEALNALGRGTWHVDDFGAVPSTLGGVVSEAQRTINVNAIQEALDTARLAGGGTVYFGPGVYHTNGTVGYNLTVDTNLAVTLQGLGPFPGAMLYCNNSAVPNFQIFNTVPNVRNIYIKDLQFLGGLTAVNLVRCFYSRFERCWNWGATQFALQHAFGGEVVFHGCFFTETGAFGDALLLYAAQALFSDTTFGEAGGGVVAIDSSLEIVGGAFQASCFYRGKNYTDYWTTPGSPTTVSMAFYAGEEAAILCINSNLILGDSLVSVAKIGVSVDLGHTVSIKGCQFINDGAAFEGFINIMRFSDLALSIDSQFEWRFNNGYFMQDASGLLHDAQITAQLITFFATITGIGIVGGKNNYANLQFMPR